MALDPIQTAPASGEDTLIGSTEQAPCATAEDPI